MSRIRRIIICVPESLLSEADGMASAERLNRSGFIRQAIKQYIAEGKRRILREQMKVGYIEMAKINLDIAGEHFNLEAEAAELYELAASGVKQHAY